MFKCKRESLPGRFPEFIGVSHKNKGFPEFIGTNHMNKGIPM